MNNEPVRLHNTSSKRKVDTTDKEMAIAKVMGELKTPEMM